MDYNPSPVASCYAGRFGQRWLALCVEYKSFFEVLLDFRLVVNIVTLTLGFHEGLHVNIHSLQKFKKPWITFQNPHLILSQPFKLHPRTWLDLRQSTYLTNLTICGFRPVSISHDNVKDCTNESKQMKFNSLNSFCFG